MHSVTIFGDMYIYASKNPQYDVCDYPKRNSVIANQTSTLMYAKVEVVHITRKYCVDIKVIKSIIF